ncbi:hypothetical protein [Rubidibacter lacunae]|uniref:hypothetical protein n=1 Tax=Rubidibacter lacunae TaxID=582514 RepID=UPI00041D8EC0|nr:hypothetical protein [Rubidibacter lacunae]
MAIALLAGPIEVEVLSLKAIARYIARYDERWQDLGTDCARGLSAGRVWWRVGGVSRRRADSDLRSQ